MQPIIQLQSTCGIGGQLLDPDLVSMYHQYKHVIFDYQTFRKTAITTRTILQDARIETLALANNLEASVVHKKVKHAEESR